MIEPEDFQREAQKIADRIAAPARMTATREVLTDVAHGRYESDLPDRAEDVLAEVEEWEAEVQRLGDDVAEQALRIIDLGQKENEAVARAEAAEAEADRLKAALTELRDAHELLKASRAKDMYDARLDALSRKAHGDPYPEIP